MTHSNNKFKYSSMQSLCLSHLNHDASRCIFTKLVETMVFFTNTTLCVIVRHWHWESKGTPFTPVENSFVMQNSVLCYSYISFLLTSNICLVNQPMQFYNHDSDANNRDSMNETCYKTHSTFHCTRMKHTQNWKCIPSQQFLWIILHTIENECCTMFVRVFCCTGGNDTTLTSLSRFSLPVDDSRINRQPYQGW